MKNLFIIFTLFLLLPGNASAQKFLDKVLKGVEKTNKILDETDKMLGNDKEDTSTQRRSKRVTGFQIVSPHPDLEIQFKRCAASSSTVVIDFVMINNGEDETLHLGGSGGDKNETLAYDDNGKLYDSHHFVTSIGSGNFDSWGVSALFPTEVPIKIRIQISDVSRTAESFKRIHINLRGVNDPIIFYNVPITRSNTTVQTAPSEEEGASSGELSAVPSTEQPANTSPCFTHPLIDPLICTSPTILVAISDIRHIDNDWNKLGLKGHVKQITETTVYGNKTNKPEERSYIFQEDGMLKSIETPYEIYLFSYQNNKLVKILSHDKKKNTTDEYTSSFVSKLQYNKQGQLEKNTFGLPTTYSYDDLGACSKIIYEEEYPENTAIVTSIFTRNSQGDICNVNTETVLYEENMDANGKLTTGAKVNTTKETYTVEYQYDNHGNWTSMLVDKEMIKYIQTKRSIEYMDS